MPRISAARNLFRYQSGRVISLGRVMLCLVLLVAVAVDHSQSHSNWVRTYSLLIIYTTAAVIIAAATWRSWWLDARLAAAAHGIDMAVFTAIVFSSNGTTSPFFLFFVLPLLAAAIRWSWRETALTATALILLYVVAGILIAGTTGFELERFIIRAGNLLILSLLLIWFGIHQSRTSLFFGAEELEGPLDAQANPLATALDFAMRVSGAREGALIIGDMGDEATDGLLRTPAESRSFTLTRPLVEKAAEDSILFDVATDRALAYPEGGRYRFFRAADVLDMTEGRGFALDQGILAEVRTETRDAWLILWRFRDLSVDYVEFGRELGRAVSTILARHALLGAIESGAAARTRLSLARDLHDSIVQFLASAAIRLEAIKRSARAGAAIESDVDDLKQLFIEEQTELRGFVAALRQNRPAALHELVSDLKGLAERLSLQWSVKCRVNSSEDDCTVPIRLQLDLPQLLREAVANAARHGRAQHVDVQLSINGDKLELKVTDDGSGFPQMNGTPAAEPWSLKERVERANGSLRVTSSTGWTNLEISLPLAGAAL